MALNRRNSPDRAPSDPPDIRHAVKSPDGRQYEVVATAKDWKLGTGSVLFDVAAFVWALVRQARGKEWVVVVRHVGTKSDPILTRKLGTRDQAAACATELAEAVARGDLALLTNEIGD